MIIAISGRADLKHNVLMLTFNPRPTIAIVKRNVVKVGMVLTIALGMYTYLSKI